MRQAGVLAAAGIVALEQMVDRLAEDHANARRLAQGLAEIGGVAVDAASVQTNIVMFGFASPAVDLARVREGLATRGVRINAMDAARFRAVTHYGVTSDDIDETLAAVRDIIRELGA